MADDQDLAAKAEALLRVAIAVMAEEIDELAVVSSRPDEGDEVVQRLLVAGKDIAHLARACAALRRRAQSF